MARIEAYADIWRPFTHVGLRTVRTLRQRRGAEDVALHIHAWPLELVNGRPQNAESTAEHVRQLRMQVSSDLFVGFDPEVFPSTTLPALALAARAYRESDRAGEAVSFAIRNALFEEGRNISDPTVLSDIASSFGISSAESSDRERVLDDWRQGQTRGVKGSPHFFCGENDVFCPSLDIARQGEGRLTIQHNLEALDSFLNRCLGN